MIQPWFTLRANDRAKVFGWLGETLREAAVLIFVFLVAEKYLSASIVLSSAWEIMCFGFAVYCFGLKLGLSSVE